ncbi:MAG: dipicolinate synthase subunit B [Bacillota bacterium]
MRLKNVKVGFAMTGSHCTIKQVLEQVALFVKEGADVTPIISDSLDTADTRFGKAAELKKNLQEITGKAPIKSIVTAEPIGPNKLFDVVVVAPCTGNTLAKLAGGITDSPVLMAIKAHLRNQRPVVLSIATNDGLGMNAKNIGLLLNTKNIYMVPFGQDSPKAKANSLVAKIEFLVDTTAEALGGKQIQPILVIY